MITFKRTLLVSLVALSFTISAMEQLKDTISTPQKEQIEFNIGKLPGDAQKLVIHSFLEGTIANLPSKLGTLRRSHSLYNTYLHNETVLESVIGCCTFTQGYTKLERTCLARNLADILAKKELTNNDKQFIQCLSDKNKLYKLLVKKLHYKPNYNADINNTKLSSAKTRRIRVFENRQEIPSKCLRNIELFLIFEFVLGTNPQCQNKEKFKERLLPLLKKLILINYYGKTLSWDPLDIVHELKKALTQIDNAQSGRS